MFCFINSGNEEFKSGKKKEAKAVTKVQQKMTASGNYSNISILVKVVSYLSIYFLAYLSYKLLPICSIFCKIHFSSMGLINFTSRSQENTEPARI